jgi:hypothetical protein
MIKAKCPLCHAAPELSEDYRKRLAMGELDPRIIARQYDISIADVMEHVYEHGEPLDVQDFGFEYYEARMKVLFRRFDDWMTIITNTYEPSESSVRMAATLSKELRENMKLMGEFAGKIGMVHYEHELADMQVKFAKLTDIIIKESCPECQSKILEAMEQEKML